MKNKYSFHLYFHLIFLVIATNINSSAQTSKIIHRKGLYYSDTITESNNQYHIYMFNVSNNEREMEIEKINIERIKSTETIISPNKKLPPKVFQYSYLRRKSKKLLFKTKLIQTEEINCFEIINSNDRAELLKITFFEDFIIVDNSKLNGIIKYQKLYRGTTYYDNGMTKSIGGYSNGKKHGLWLIYNEDGTRTTKRYNYGTEISSMNHE